MEKGNEKLWFSKEVSEIVKERRMPTWDTGVLEIQKNSYREKF